MLPPSSKPPNLDSHCIPHYCSFPEAQTHTIQLHLIQEYCGVTLQDAIQDKLEVDETFSEADIWHVVRSCVEAALALKTHGFKEALLSPRGIKIQRPAHSPSTQAPFWSSQLGHAQQHRPSSARGLPDDTPSAACYRSVDLCSAQIKVGEWELSHLFEDPMQSLRSHPSLSEVKYFYWPPEGVSSLHLVTDIGRASLAPAYTSHGQVFSLGMTVLEMCLRRNLLAVSPFSEKSISALIEEAVMVRTQQNTPCSAILTRVLKAMLEW